MRQQVSAPSSCICGGKGLLYCDICKSQRYCSRECKKKDWRIHKKICSPSLRAKPDDIIYSFEEGVNKGYPRQDTNILTRADVQRFNAQIDGAKSLSLLFDHFRNHITSVWTDVCSMFRMTSLMKMNIMCLPFVTVPKNDKWFMEAIPVPKYWTFLFVFTPTYIKNIYLSFSDHVDGIIRRKIQNGGLVICDSNTFLCGKIGENDDGEILTFDALDENMKYFHIEWETGTVLGEVYLNEL